MAIFVDDTSASVAISATNAEWINMLVAQPPLLVSSVGAPARTFLLSDLALDTIDWAPYRLCVFLNAYVVPPHIAAAIATKLKGGGKTLVWTHMAGVLAAPSPAGPRALNTTAMSELVGINLTRGAGASPLFTHVPAGPTLGPGFPRDYGSATVAVDPWFYHAGHSGAAQEREHERQQQAAQVEVLGTLAAAGTAALATLVRAVDVGRNYTSVFSSTPGMPVQLWRALAATAGVHMYVDDSACSVDPDAWEAADSVEVRGRFLLVHAAATCSGVAAVRRAVRLPAAVKAVTAEGGATVCTDCDTFQTPPMVAGDVHLFTLG